MQLTSLLVCFMTMAPVVIHAAPIPSSDLSLDLVKRVATPAKPVAKPPTTKPPPAAPVKNPPKPSATGGTSKPGLGTAPPGGAADTCSGLSKRVGTLPTCSCFQRCQTCTAQSHCAFSTVTFKCEDKGSGNGPADSLIGLGPKNSNPRCIAVSQQSVVFPSTGQGAGQIPAGLPDPDTQREFELIKNHIFTLDNQDPKRKDSGQHLKSVWIANHPTGPKSTPDNSAACNSIEGTGLCSFMQGSKTVWNDDPGFYTKRDVQNMCSVALKLAGPEGGQHVVMSPMGKKLCIFAKKRNEKKFNAQTGAGEGSCFPVGTAATNINVHDTCPGTAND